MAFKYFVAAFLISTAQAGIFSVQEQHAFPLEHAQHHETAAVYHHAPGQVAHISHAPAHTVHLVQKQQPAHEQYPDDPHPQYNFAYDVQDAVSGDSKSQSESRDGDVVHGEYSLNDADGFRRTVKYTADSVNGFNAVVEREPLTHKVVAAAPVQYHHVPATAQAYAAVPAQHQATVHTSYEAPHQEEQQYYHH